MELRDASTFDATVQNGILYTREVMYAGRGKTQVAFAPIMQSDPQKTERYYDTLTQDNIHDREKAYAFATIPVVLAAPASLYALSLLRSVSFAADGHFDPTPTNLTLALFGVLISAFAIAVSEGSKANGEYIANRHRLITIRQAIRRDKIRQLKAKTR